jgi:hypothetical protein
VEKNETIHTAKKNATISLQNVNASSGTSDKHGTFWQQETDQVVLCHFHANKHQINRANRKENQCGFKETLANLLQCKSINNSKYNATAITDNALQASTTRRKMKNRHTTMQHEWRNELVNILCSCSVGIYTFNYACEG